MQYCAAAVNGVAQAKTVTYSFATAGYTPVGLNFLSRRVAPEQAGVGPLTVSAFQFHNELLSPAYLTFASLAFCTLQPLPQCVP